MFNGAFYFLSSSHTPLIGLLIFPPSKQSSSPFFPSLPLFPLCLQCVPSIPQLFRSWVRSANDGIKEQGNQWWNEGEMEGEGNAEVHKWMNLGEWGEIWAELLTVGKEKIKVSDRGGGNIYKYIFHFCFHFCQGTIFRQRCSSHGALKDFSFSLCHRQYKHVMLFSTFYQGYFSWGESNLGSHLSLPYHWWCFLTSPGGRNWQYVSPFMPGSFWTILYLMFNVSFLEEAIYSAVLTGLYRSQKILFHKPAIIFLKKGYI